MFRAVMGGSALVGSSVAALCGSAEQQGGKSLRQALVSRSEHSRRAFVAFEEPARSRVCPNRSRITATSGARAKGPGTVAAAVVDVETTEPQQEAERSPEAFQVTDTKKPQFVWEQQWYPVGLLKDFDRVVPAAVTILGIPLVVWWDGKAQEYKVFHDLCPHRLAPLSEGRIHESGALQCSYHGWTFEGDGSCSRIPQADKGGPAVNSSPRACARVYPSRQHQGLLWFWSQHGPAAAEAAAGTAIPSVPELSDPDFHVNTGQCDLNYGYEMLVENLSDPAHVPFAHHKIQGNRDKATPLDFSVKSIQVDGVSGSGGLLRDWVFHPPCLINSTLFPGRPQAGTANQPKGKQGAEAAGTGSPGKAGEKQRKMSMSFFCIPRSPGRSRLIFAFAYNFMPPVAKLIPRWYSHMNQMLVLDSDHFFLHLLERRLQDEGGASNALRAFYAPTKSDAFVLAFRKWLIDFAGAQVQWPAQTDMQMPVFHSKRELMDRQENHVKICKDCQGAQRGFEWLQLALQISSLAVLAATALSVALRAPSGLSAAAAVAGALALSSVLGVVSFLLSRFIQRIYYFRDYVHALV